MSDLPRLSEAEIRRWIGEESFARGSRYFHDRAILNPRLAGPTLKAQCQGSRAQPYRVEVTLGPTGIVAGNCSCPVGGGGHCKHAAALLLTWLDNPDGFVEVEDLAANLDRRSKADLIALIGRMVERYPDLEMLIELPVPGERGSKPLDAENIRRQVRHALYSGGDEWDLAPEVYVQLSQIADLGDGYAGSGDWPNAAIVYETIIRKVLEEYGTFQDEGGSLGAIVSRCVGGLGDCLSATADPAQRANLLRALFDTYAWDVEHGGYGMADEAPEIIVEQATPEERREVARWVRSAVPAGDSWSSNYQRETYGGFLLDLEQDTLDDEAWLRICRETGRVLDLVDRLLELQRVEEAREVGQGASDYDLLQMADIFKAHGQVNLVADLIRERAKDSRDTRLAEWLKQQAIERGDQREALSWAQQLFWQNPFLGGYRQAKALAQAAGTWDRLQPEILSRLLEQERYPLLTEVYLEEGEIDRALDALERLRSNWWAGPRSELVIQVAAAAEELRPRESIRLYSDAAQTLIGLRGRDNYVAAAQYLSRVRRLYERLGEESTWQALIADIRRQNTRLHALKEELNRAGL